jgi:hypothetical protein
LWMNQVGRNLTDATDGLLNGKRYLIHDRDPLFTGELLSMPAEVGVASGKLPPRSPKAGTFSLSSDPFTDGAPPSVSGCCISTTLVNHALRFECADPSPTTGRTSGLIPIMRAEVNDLHCQFLTF